MSENGRRTAVEREEGERILAEKISKVEEGLERDEVGGRKEAGERS